MSDLDPNEKRPEELWAEIHRLRAQVNTNKGTSWRELAIQRKNEVFKCKSFFRHAIFILTSGQFDFSDPDIEQKRLEFFKEKFKDSELILGFIAPLIGLCQTGEKDDE